jgi:hypothetical protein
VANPSRPRSASCRNLGDGDIGVWVHYDDRELAKALPGRRWDKHLKCWRVSTMFRAEAEALINQLNGGIDQHLVDALATMFQALPASLRGTTYKSLIKIWHPDVGGDTPAMQALTAAWERMQ